MLESLAAQHPSLISEGYTVGDPVQPTSKGFALANGAGLARQYEEGCLESVFDILFSVEQAPADTMNQALVSPHEELKGSLIALGHESLEELGIGNGRALLAQLAVQVSQKRRQLRLCHGDSAPRKHSFYINSGGGKWEAVKFFFQLG
jgi:hypothetical protein